MKRMEGLEQVRDANTRRMAEWESRDKKRWKNLINEKIEDYLFKQVKNLAVCDTCHACIGPRLPNGPLMDHVYI